MSVFRDIAVVTKKVTLADGTQIEVRKLSLRQIAGLLHQFPALGDLANGKSVAATDIAVAAPEAIGAIIAAGVGKPNDAETLAEIDDKVDVYDQITLLEGIADITLPGGVGPLMERLARIGVALGAKSTAEPGTAEASKTDSPNSSAA